MKKILLILTFILLFISLGFSESRIYKYDHANENEEYVWELDMRSASIYKIVKNTTTLMDTFEYIDFRGLGAEQITEASQAIWDVRTSTSTIWYNPAEAQTHIEQ